ncbi:phosphoadenosine phosphosulfate reductase family protein [uncultured Aquabacterium sp.]|uniref:phosphoadenosine phosphosulfate reductase domain-containing protein n=1 Tax=uncultured Aquabacterium sp. TaxID=158753 RepID=UPI0025F574DC|nr:phosphoadenosine phosphosulfate reductase family protein [uncultured Aquabacterium sp.]
MGVNVENTIADMKRLAKTHDRVCVGFSGGKDSLVCLDLAVRFFSEVVPFCMYLVPDLDCDRQRTAIAKERYGLDVHFFPHPVSLNYLQGGYYCDFLPFLQAMPEVHPWTYYKGMMGRMGCTLMIDGMKKADGSFRRRKLATETEEEKRMTFRPLKQWLKWEVLSYLKARDIPLPKSHTNTAAGNSGTSLQVQEVLTLHDYYPADYEKVRAIFPYVDAIVARREFFGLTDG